ncbi:MAG: class I SAM-dependent methyltransferase [Pirellula sp.]
MESIVILLLLAIGFGFYWLYQYRKPSRWFGQLHLASMNRSHAELTDWGLSHVGIGDAFHILDVGCGGGRTLERLAAIAVAGQVHGIDNAEGSVLASKRWNAEAIRQGRIHVALASVEAIPFPDRSFDLVTAVETQYFWPDLDQAMQEVDRVLKPGGQFMVIAEYYRKETREPMVGWGLALLRAHRLSLQEHRELLMRAGFVDIRILEEVDRGWLCAIGCKPMQP